MQVLVPTMYVHGPFPDLNIALHILDLLRSVPVGIYEVQADSVATQADPLY